MKRENVKNIYISLMVISICSTVVFCSCSQKVKRAEAPPELNTIDRPEVKVLRIRWVLRYTGSGENVFTNAVITVQGEEVQRHSIGSFYGKVVSTIEEDDINVRQLPVNTVSGFITRNNGEGHEVYALYNRDLHTIHIMSRQLSRKNSDTRFHTIMKIPVAEAGRVENQDIIQDN